MQEWFFILLPAFSLGLLHTAIPCEDKAIFFFWNSGISKDAKHSVFILVLYGLGLMSANMAIALVTVLVSLIPRFLGFVPDPYGINFFGAFTSTFAAIFLLFFVTRRDYLPHSRYKEQIPLLNWNKTRTPYLFGLLAGFPPCIFELFIYSQCLTYSLSYGFFQGILTVFYFSLGTFIGLFPFALAKQSSSQLLGETPSKKKKIFFIMILIIIIFNVIIMILSFLRIDVFTVERIAG
ncbi:MAG: urease accessory protein UreH domain-containing protein [Promethearchaeota archaeon]